MNPVSSVMANPRASGLGRAEAPAPRIAAGPMAPDPARTASPEGFGNMLDGLVSNYSAKETEASAITRKVLLGESDQIHQSMIAMQEASVAFSLMVEVRNKLVESYQEMMRMQV